MDMDGSVIKMKKQIHELKMKLYEWRKKKIEEKYFKTFPERKGGQDNEKENTHISY